jgi:hypothetical protein
VSVFLVVVADSVDEIQDDDFVVVVVVAVIVVVLLLLDTLELIKNTWVHKSGHFFKFKNEKNGKKKLSFGNRKQSMSACF